MNRQRHHSAIRLCLGLFGVGLLCHFSTKVGFANKIPPHYISALWPTGAILFSVLVVTRPRHWPLYIAAAYFTSVIEDVRNGFPSWAAIYIVAGLLEIVPAAVAVRRYAGGVRAFDNLLNLTRYLAIAVVIVPAASAFIGALAGGTQHYWFYWRVWFLSEALAYLTVAPAILACIPMVRAIHDMSTARLVEAGSLLIGVLAVCLWVFNGPPAGEAHVPAMVYLPLPLLLWLAIRFGPPGVGCSLLVLAVVSIAGAVHGRGPFAAAGPGETALSLQLFLLTVSTPLMFLATLIVEVRDRTMVLAESEARFREMADTAPVMIWMCGTDKLCSFFNKPWLDFTGRTQDQESGNGWSEGVHRDDLSEYLRIYNESFDARRPFMMEYRLRRRDGEYRWVSDHGIPRHDSHGNFVGYIGSCADITERKQSEERLQRTLAELQQIKEQLDKENTYLRQEVKVLHGHHEIVGQSPALQQVLAAVERVADTDSSVLLLGETGTGKELIAREIHNLSSRRDKAMVCVNCAAMPATLIESELFGREKGAYTGAMTKQLGRFEAAHHSTLFLDEVGDLPGDVQVKLLRVLQERQIERLGSSKPIAVDVRIIAATNRDLEQEVRNGRFRQDLYYRLTVFPIKLPPLRERSDDIPLLVMSFVEHFSKSMGKQIDGISKPDLMLLQRYRWPGNVRELRNTIERAMILATGNKLRIQLPAEEVKATPTLSLFDIEREHILNVLEKTQWRVQGAGGAADLLGVKRTTLESRMIKLGIRRPNK